LETAPDLEDADVDPCEARAIELVCELRRRQPYCEIAILTRSNPPIGRLISRLRSLGIDASQEGGNPLTDSAGVELILSVLRLADHPGDTVASYHVRQSPLADRFCLAGSCDEEAKQGAEFARTVSRTIRAKLVEGGLGRTVSNLVADLRPMVGLRDRERLRQLVTLAHRFEPSFRLRTVDFIDFVEMERVASPTAKPVRVMTIHMSKGLEFDAVILPELDVELIGTADLLITRANDLIAPPRSAVRYCSKERRAYLSEGWQGAFEQDEDDRTTGTLCTLYVALTRAKHALHIVVPVQRKSPPTEKKLAALLVNSLGLPDVDATKPSTILFEAGSREWLADPRPATQLGLRFDEAHDPRPLKWSIRSTSPQDPSSLPSVANVSEPSSDFRVTSSTAQGQ
jgi:ATP-dependent exoDNAse (exonuclease V) beta subunit